MEATFKVKANEFDQELFNEIKKIAGKDNIIEIHISDKSDETDFLLSTRANRESLQRSLKELEKNEVISKTAEELLL